MLKFCSSRKQVCENYFPIHFHFSIKAPLNLAINLSLDQSVSIKSEEIIFACFDSNRRSTRTPSRSRRKTLFSDASTQRRAHTACHYPALMMMSAEKMNKILAWLRTKDTVWDEQMCVAAVADGELDVLKWLRELGCDWDEGTCNNAAKFGHIEVLRWAHGTAALGIW